MNRKFRNVAFTAICSSLMVNVAVSATRIKSVNVSVMSVFGNTDYNNAFVVAVRNNLNRLASFNVEKEVHENKVEEQEVIENGITKKKFVEVESGKIFLRQENGRKFDFDIGDSCAICFESLKFDGNEDIMITSCGHRYHKDCIGKWLSKSTKCPYCNRNLTGQRCDLFISEETYNQARNNNGHQHIHNNPMLNQNNNPFFFNDAFNNMVNNVPQVNMFPFVMPNAFSAPRYLRAPLFYQAIPNIFRYCTENMLNDNLAGIAAAITPGNMFPRNLLNKDQIPDNYFKKLPLLNGTLSRHIHAQCAYCGRTCWNNDVNSTYIITSCHHAYHPQCLKQHIQNLGLNSNSIACPCQLCGGTIFPQGYAVLKDSGEKLVQWIQTLFDVYQQSIVFSRLVRIR